MKVAAFDMDNTILKKSFIESAAIVFGFKDQLAEIRKNTNTFTRTKFIADLLKGKTLVDLLEIIDKIDITSGLESTILALKKRGYITGIISDSYNCVTNYLKKKYGFDFHCSYELEFVKGNTTGNVRIPSLFVHRERSLCSHEYCKLNALLKVCDHYGTNLENVLMVGDGENDICCIQKAGIGISFCSTNARVDSVAKHIIKKRDFKLVNSILD